MPVPKPKKGEKKNDYVQRFMRDKNMAEYGSAQRLAIAFNTWRQKERDER